MIVCSCNQCMLRMRTSIPVCMQGLKGSLEDVYYKYISSGEAENVRVGERFPAVSFR